VDQVSRNENDKEEMEVDSKSRGVPNNDPTEDKNIPEDRKEKIEESQPNILSGGSRLDTTLTVPVPELELDLVSKVDAEELEVDSKSRGVPNNENKTIDDKTNPEGRKEKMEERKKIQGRDICLTSYSAWWNRMEKEERKFYREVEKEASKRKEEEMKKRQKKEETNRKKEEFLKKFFWIIRLMIHFLNN
jgi:hypothetical protein